MSKLFQDSITTSTDLQSSWKKEKQPKSNNTTQTITPTSASSECQSVFSDYVMVSMIKKRFRRTKKRLLLLIQRKSVMQACRVFWIVLKTACLKN